MSAARRTADDRQPKYLRIHSALRERITSGRWAAGDPLPSQRELAGEFGVSIMTMRQAIQLLADDGLIEARHGSGTYVASRYAYGLGHLRSFAADLAAQGAQITTQLLAADTVAAPDDVGARLGAAGQVLRLRRLRLADGRPVIVQTSYLPAQLAAALDPADLCRRGLWRRARAATAQRPASALSCGFPVVAMTLMTYRKPRVRLAMASICSGPVAGVTIRVASRPACPAASR